MLSLNAFMYFNQGKNSGASQPHKHMQLIPFESMQTKNLPVEQVALQQYESQRQKLFTLNQFQKFQHVVGMLDFGRLTFDQLVGSEDSYLQAADIILKTYWECLGFLGITPENHNGDEDTKDPSYNVWITPRMVFIVLRSKNTVEGPQLNQADPMKPTVDINTLGFAGTIATKNEASFEFLKSLGPIKALEEVAQKCEIGACPKL